ncbi:MAG: tRNA lysidine(34) synthetase TilS, partial [Actinobacteria bacterium]|nr:tRNA lysidine(34) synthetase TilS [Actinomycetota bacterium]
MALMCLAVAHGLHVTAVHVDHGIRTDSHRDIALIAPVARVLGVELQVHRVVVEPGPNLEARARAARYGVLPDDAMTGHTADDQAETVLINLLRGAGSAGLSAMSPGAKRPILGLRRAETHQLCTELGIECVDDETNRSDAHQRNRVRHELLPVVADISRRDPVPILVRTSDVLRDDNALLDELAAGIDPTDAIALSTAPLPLARRAIRAWLSHPYPPDQATVERVLEV